MGLYGNNNKEGNGMAKENLINGEHVNFDVTGVRVTDALLEALTILDRECRFGSGGTWDISREGRKLIATPVGGPFDTLFFNKRKGKWSV